MRTIPALPDPRLVAAFQRASAWMAGTGTAIGALVLIGWFAGFETLRSVHPSFAQMKVNTAVGFALLGGALILQRVPATMTRVYCAAVMAQLALALGLLTLLEHGFHIDLGIDQLLMPRVARAVPGHWPGRMSEPTALGLTLVAFAVATFNRSATQDPRLGQWLAVVAMLIATLVLAGYLCGAKALYSVSGRGQIAPHTAVALMLLSVAALCARPEHGLMKTLTSCAATGTLARRLIPLVIVIPLALGLAHLVGQRLDWWSEELGTAFEVVGNVVSLAGVCFWIVQKQLRAELELAEREQDLSTTLDSIGDGVIATDACGLIVRMNPVAEELTGWSLTQASGRPLDEIFSLIDESSGEPIESPAETVLREGRIIDLVDRAVLIAKTGVRRPIADSGAPIRDAVGNVRGVVLVFRDLTAHKQAQAASEQLGRIAREEQQRRQTAESALQHTEEQLRQTQKMEAIGTLAGGIAHDFNNLLTVILSYTDLLMERPAPTSMRGDLEEIKSAAKRASEMTRQLLAFSRKQVLQPRVLDLNEVVASLAKMLGRLIGEHIELQILPAPELGRVEVDPGQFEQALINLVVNARDAMADGGRITIETANASLDAAASPLSLPVDPGDYVMVSVRDTGTGMDQATLARIFEPFFSTKTKERGTGLGLSTVFGIMKQSGGGIAVESEPGQGSVFRLYLPRVSAAPASGISELPPPAKLYGTETVLLAEDDPQLRKLFAEMLTRNGYHVIQAADGEDALARAEQHSGTIELLLTDVVMPRLGGRLLADRILRVRPQTRVLFMSGYTDDTVLIHGIQTSAIAWLQKPIEPRDLLLRVRALLDPVI